MLVVLLVFVLVLLFVELVVPVVDVFVLPVKFETVVSVVLLKCVVFVDDDELVDELLEEEDVLVVLVDVSADADVLVGSTPLSLGLRLGVD